MRTLPQRLGTFSLAVAIIIALAAAAYASDNFAVPFGGYQSITAYSVCRKVTNGSGTGAALYVPTQTAAEWQSFRDNPPPGVTLGTCGGSISYTIPGTYTFTVPEYATLTVEAWGGGGGGGHCYMAFTGGKFGSYYRFCWGGNTAGAASSFNGVAANGGGTGDGAPGGTATGGDVNLSGESGTTACTVPGVYTYGGGGGSGLDPVATRHGIAPGGGGDGNCQAAQTYGGGGGGYVKKTWSSGVLTAGADYTVIVGSGGSNASGNGAAPGAPGRVVITWQ